MGSVHDNGDGSFRVRVSRGSRTDGSRRTVTETVWGTRADAEARCAAIAAELGRSGAYGDSMTFGEWCPIFMAAPSNRGAPRAATTIVGYEAQIRYLLPIIGHRPLSSLRHEELAALVRAAGSPVNCKRVLRAILRAAYDAGLMDWKAFERRVPVRRAYSRKKEPWTRFEAMEALAAPLSDDLRAYLVLGLSGLRMEEALGLRGCDVRSERVYSWLTGDMVETVTARVSWTWTDAGGHVEAVKNDMSARVVPILPQGREWLLGRCDGLEGRVVPLTGDALYKRWRRACDNLGLRFIPPSQLRHTSDTLMISAGVEPDLNARMHGRANTSTTYEHYYRPDMAVMEAAMHKVGDILHNPESGPGAPVTVGDRAHGDGAGDCQDNGW